jgi:hypothetical protein
VGIVNIGFFALGEERMRKEKQMYRGLEAG